jgi:hypothetical protein
MLDPISIAQTDLARRSMFRFSLPQKPKYLSRSKKNLSRPMSDRYFQTRAYKAGLSTHAYSIKPVYHPQIFPYPC